MSNIHPANSEGYVCPDKGNRFPLFSFSKLGPSVSLTTTSLSSPASA